MADFKRGDVVDADFGDGYKVAFVAKGAHDVSGETKYGIQSPDGGVVKMAYREKDDVQASGGTSGLTFKSL